MSEVYKGLGNWADGGGGQYRKWKETSREWEDKLLYPTPANQSGSRYIYIVAVPLCHPEIQQRYSLEHLGQRRRRNSIYQMC